MANYDFYPNPLTIELEPLGAHGLPLDMQAIIADYKKQRVKYALDPQKKQACVTIKTGGFLVGV